MRLALLLILSVVGCTFAQAQEAQLKLRLINEIDSTLILDARVASGKIVATESDSNGYYHFSLTPDKKYSFKITSLGYEQDYFHIQLNPYAIVDTVLVLKSLFSETLGETKIEDESYRSEAGKIKIDVSKSFVNPGPNSGVEGILKIFTGDHNELTSQYKVRGGNFDENLVYVNDFEIFRPFLVRSGQLCKCRSCERCKLFCWWVSSKIW